MAQFPEYRHWYIAGHSMGGGDGLPVCRRSPRRDRRPDSAGRLYIRGLSARRHADGLRLAEPERGGTNWTTPKTWWRSRAATTLSSATTAPRKGMPRPPSPPRNSRRRRWKPSCSSSGSGRQPEKPTLSPLQRGLRPGLGRSCAFLWKETVGFCGFLLLYKAGESITIRFAKSSAAWKQGGAVFFIAKSSK